MSEYATCLVILAVIIICFIAFVAKNKGAAFFLGLIVWVIGAVALRGVMDKIERQDAVAASQGREQYDANRRQIIRDGMDRAAQAPAPRR